MKLLPCLCLLVLGISPMIRAQTPAPPVGNSTGGLASSPAAERVINDPSGRIIIRPIPVAEKFRNPWPDAWEKEFQDRLNQLIPRFKGKSYGNTHGENEKRSYPNAMMDFLAGNRAGALKFLQAPDAEQGRDAACGGTDYYWCFTLKGQVRKYFFFGPYLDPAHRQKMFDDAKVWTATDPAKRLNPNAEACTNAVWGAKKTRVCVDTRTTDNLQAMRIAAAYLLAEETGNQETAAVYRRQIIDTLHAMFTVGMGEWDSANYLGHTMTGYIQLYDFAKDPQMKLLGKAAMDYMTATAALKYRRGAFGGPDKRDYNSPFVYGGSTAQTLSLYYGQVPIPNHDPESDAVHFLTSAYRPPPAAVELARQEIALPVEVFTTHPGYNALRSAQDRAPAYHGVNFLTQTYRLSTLAEGTCDADVNGFCLLADNDQRGADFFIANTTTDPSAICSPQYHDDQFVAGNNIGQYRNVAIWLNNRGDAPFIFLSPKSAPVTHEQGVWFIQMQSTWVALRPLNLKFTGVDPELTRIANIRISVDRKTQKQTENPRWPDEQILSGKGLGGRFCGFVIEVGSKHDLDFPRFKTEVLSKSKLDDSRLAQGVVSYTSAEGRTLKVQHLGQRVPQVTRDGQTVDWSKWVNPYQPADDGTAPILMRRGEGKLRVESRHWIYEGQLTADGTYTFVNRPK